VQRLVVVLAAVTVVGTMTLAGDLSYAQSPQQHPCAAKKNSLWCCGQAVRFDRHVPGAQRRQERVAGHYGLPGITSCPARTVVAACAGTVGAGPV
jgi:hypothetical protein